jgi:hypothetical protein
MTASEAPPERRQFKRAQLPNDVVLTIDGHRHPCSLIDISGGGVALWTDLRPDIGKAVFVEIEDMGDYQGRVVRHLENGIGVQFDIEEGRKFEIINKLTENLLSL